MKLPCTYTQEDLSVDSNEVATIDKIKRWNYLDKITAEVNANDNTVVTLLIGVNCAKVLEPRELIASKNGFICIQNTLRMVSCRIHVRLK